MTESKFPLLQEKVCGCCGKIHKEVTNFVGIQYLGDVATLVLWDCSCLSTIAIQIELVKNSELLHNVDKKGA